MRLLIVEDEPRIAAFLKNSLEAELFAVDIAEDGEKGSRYARVNEYDLVMLDYHLPKKDGLMVCRDIRDRGLSMPILMLSVEDGVTDRVALLDAGADDYVTKPFTISEVSARVRALLRRPRALRSESFSIGDVSLDSRKGTAKIGKRTLNLTRKEFMLLEYLMRNPDTVLSRAMILEHVWEMDVDLFSNTIESHILSLRRKLGDDDKSVIQTVSGRGYRMPI